LPTSSFGFSCPRPHEKHPTPGAVVIDTLAGGECEHATTKGRAGWIGSWSWWPFPSRMSTDQRASTPSSSVFNADHDHTVSDEVRFVQLTPPGSACSIALGTGLVDAAPGSVEGMQLVVPDIKAAHDQLVERGVDVSDVQVFPWGSFVFFNDPDGNGWAVQQLPGPD
jgi:hypothetical protein